MAAKSDFAQKLLNDLRMRKEKMAAAQNSSRQSTQKPTGQTSRGSRQANTNRTHSNRNTREPSNQMVLYDKKISQNQQQLKVRDLSMAIAFAFESSGNLTSASNNPLANFFNQFNQRPRNTNKTNITTFGNRSHLPTVSNIQITEVSKGVQKLNQILQACSNGFSLDGKELLKGAIDLEESLRMLVELQEYGSNTQQNKSRLRLLDEDEDEDNAEIAQQWKLDRPKFSFDKKAPHKRSIQDLSISSSSQLGNKGISNVVAKLMGLEEIPQNEDFRLKKNDPKGKFSKQSSNFSSQAIAANPVNRHQVLDAGGRKQSPTVDKQSKMLASSSSNTDLQQKGQNIKSLKTAGYRTNDSIKQKLGTNSTNKELARNKQKKEEKRVLPQELVAKRGEVLEGTKRHKEKNDQHFQRQVKPTIPLKSKKSTAVKKLPRDESTHGVVKSTAPSEKVLTKDRKTKIHQVDVPVIDISQPNMENVKKEDEEVHNLSTREPQLDMEKETRKVSDKPIEVSVKQNKAPIIPVKVQRSEIPKKIDVLMSRRNVNHLSRSIKHPADSNMLKDLKQRLHSKNRVSRRMEEQNDDKFVKDENEGITNNASESMNAHEQVKKQEMLQNEDEHRGVLKTSITKEYQIQKLQKTPTREAHSDTTDLISGKASVDFWKVEHPYALEDEQGLKQHDLRIGNNIKPECTELHARQEQLTEPEKELKETIIKSQTLLSTADALFKLNIPVSFLHVASEQQDYEDAENKLILNCANEVMKRKARRHSTHNHTKIQSLDDLIRQLCKDLETMKFYGGDTGDDVAARLHSMVERDIYQRDVDVNSMWDVEWCNIKSLVVGEKEDVVRDVEKWVLNGLVDEFTSDLISVS